MIFSISPIQIGLQACDNGVPRQCITSPLRINVIRDSFPPQFAVDPIEFFMEETESAGYIVGKIEATDNQKLVSLKTYRETVVICCMKKN